MVFFKHRGIFTVGFHVSGGILVILCAFGGGGGVWSFFLKFQEYFGHYLGFRGNLVFFFFSTVHWSFFGIGCILDIFCGYEGIVVIFF